MSPQNNYDGMIASWKVERIRYRAKHVGLTGHDFDDAVQEIVLYLFTEFKHDHSRSSDRTATSIVINNRLKMFLRSRRRYRKMIEKAAEPEKTETPQGQIQLALDIQELYATMSPEEQTICVSLSEGYSANEIASRWHCHPSKIQRIIKRIRQLFQERGMQAWLGA